MAKKNTANENYEILKNDVKNGTYKQIYAFTGEEQYLLETYLGKIREALIPEGMEMFNHRRLEGKGLDLSELAEALEAYPAFCEYTLTEVEDFDFASLGEGDKIRLLELLSDIPEHAILIFRFNTVPLKLDGRLKLDSAIKKLMFIVEFNVQEGATLIRWIMAHVRANGREISAPDAEFFAFYTGGLMTNLNTEIDKVCASCEGKYVTRDDIERMVTPEINAAVFNMTDAILRNDYSAALTTLSELYEMHSEPRMIFAVLGSSIKQLYYTKFALKENKSPDYIGKALGIKYSFQVNKLIDGARKKSENWCSNAMELCVQTAYKLNSTSGLDDSEAVMDLVLKLAV